MSFDTDRTRCVEIIRPHNYFEEKALQICAEFTFDSNKNQCVGYIGSKQYDAYEIEECQNATFDSEKLTCLKKNGRPVNDGGNRPCLPRHEVLNQLHSGLNDLRSGDLGTVDKRLQYLISNFSQVNCK